jgi:hypothetical protein
VFFWVVGSMFFGSARITGALLALLVASLLLSVFGHYEI